MGNVLAAAVIIGIFLLGLKGHRKKPRIDKTWGRLQNDEREIFR
jgi:hypothetical protein